MKIISYLKALFFLLIIFSIVNCGGGSGTPADNTGHNLSGTVTPTDNTENNPPATVTGSINGIVQNAKTQFPVPGLIVSAGDSSATTSITGSYSLKNISSNNRIVVTIQGAGYTEQSKIVRLNKQNQVIDLNVSILPVDASEEFDPGLTKDLTVTDSPAMVKLTANSLVQADGTTRPSGRVTSSLTVIDPAIDIDLMPGDMQTDTDGGTLAQIESFGAITTTFKDAAGNDLNLADGSPATIRIPVASNTANPPTTIPLYFYNKETGLWVEEGSAALDPTEKFYEGRVTHFSTWNADLILERITIKGCVEDTDGKRLENVFIRSEGKNYSGAAFAYTDNAGNFSVFAKSNALVAISGRASFRSTNIVEAQTTTSDITLESCLVLDDTITGNTSGGGTLTLSGADTEIVGTSLEFLDAIDLNSSTGFLITATPFEDSVGGESTDPDNTFSLFMMGEDDRADFITILTITVQARTYVYSCGRDCNGTNTITFNETDDSITFTNAVLQRTGFINTGENNRVDIVINGAIQWRNYDAFGVL
ncbi:MAG: hypothetical protein GXP14_03305 [Gammaproteobacteria bacterium]|nr:hypothetical protein [Gammaproteobacteria bacterium]